MLYMGLFAFSVAFALRHLRLPECPAWMRHGHAGRALTIILPWPSDPVAALAPGGLLRLVGRLWFWDP